MLAFLKLGGSLITNKDLAHTVHPDVLNRLAEEIACAYRQDPELRLVIGHGSGSFGHIPAKKFRTRDGVRTPEEWQGFTTVWNEARALNQVVIEALASKGLPIIAMPPSASVISAQGKVASWDLRPVKAALAAGLIPVVNGDTIFDLSIGGTILSTEELFLYLATQLQPKRILISGSEAGVWADFSTCTHLITDITPNSYPSIAASLSGSNSVDVTGGMAKKVESMLSLIQDLPDLEVLIFSGKEPGQVKQALLGSTPGTRIHRD